MLPVPESISVVFGIAAKVDDDAHEEKTDERDDLQAAEPEL